MRIMYSLEQEHLSSEASLRVHSTDKEIGDSVADLSLRVCAAKVFQVVSECDEFREFDVNVDRQVENFFRTPVPVVCMWYERNAGGERELYYADVIECWSWDVFSEIEDMLNRSGLRLVVVIGVDCEFFGVFEFEEARIFVKLAVD